MSCIFAWSPSPSSKLQPWGTTGTANRACPDSNPGLPRLKPLLLQPPYCSHWHHQHPFRVAPEPGVISAASHSLAPSSQKPAGLPPASSLPGQLRPRPPFPPHPERPFAATAAERMAPGPCPHHLLQQRPRATSPGPFPLLSLTEARRELVTPLPRMHRTLSSLPRNWAWRCSGR